eukprot:CAMPEP_0114245002 /NCGR_PEP_ID=MMETSP0058-20121206/11650_1 /TAXON_ID=36894 /ORGANISM="Pyramimonas parkeae, CCMP726" /LENGTH=294 /DNA_ID=CAMNT_0001357999 /DNA_START=4 /DNA_END=888 /DNA_ORIENTATION=-
MASKRKISEMEEADMDAVLELAMRAARSAGAIISGVWDQKSDVKDTKSNSRDLVTETDQKCEEIIVEMIKKAYPDHHVIGEETVGAGKYDLGDGPTWTIDPIDGTTNFVHRIPAVCVLIAFIMEKQPVVAVTYDPINDEMYSAIKGRGAQLKSSRHDGPISVSSCDSIDRAVAGLESGYGRDPKTVNKLTSTIEGLMTKGVRTLRIGGACGLNCTNIASGRWDVFFEEGDWDANTGPKIWDFSPAKLIVEEAGGVMLSLDGSPFDLMGRSVFAAANRKLAEEVIDIMKTRKLAI